MVEFGVLLFLVGIVMLLVGIVMLFLSLFPGGESKKKYGLRTLLISGILLLTSWSLCSLGGGLRL